MVLTSPAQTQQLYCVHNTRMLWTPGMKVLMADSGAADPFRTGVAREVSSPTGESVFTLISVAVQKDFQCSVKRRPLNGRTDGGSRWGWGECMRVFQSLRLCRHRSEPGFVMGMNDKAPDKGGPGGTRRGTVDRVYNRGYLIGFYLSSPAWLRMGHLPLGPSPGLLARSQEYGSPQQAENNPRQSTHPRRLPADRSTVPILYACEYHDKRL